MKKNIFTISLPLGIALGFLYPFAGLEFSKWTFVFLLLLMFLNFLNVDFKVKELASFSKSDIYTIFFSFCFIPSLFIFLSHILKLSEPVTLGFFLTNLAPFAIVAPQFLDSETDKKGALKLVLFSTFLFPFYFTAMFYLFFEKSFRIHSLPIFQDALLLVIIPLVLLFPIRKFKINLFLKPHLNYFVPKLNMLIIGILCFIYTGSTFLKNNFSHISLYEVSLIILLALLQDFGTYYIARLFGLARYQAVSLSAKNVALTGLFATLFFPKSILPIVVVLATHFLLFNYLTILIMPSSPNPK
jgi:predicted Na+-dependent transporter